jgi:hypothetical protein
MELLALPVALLLFGALALRFGHDSRDGLYPREDHFAAQRKAKAELTAETGEEPASADRPSLVRLLTRGSLQAVGAGQGYPTLTLIDRALNDPARAFSDAPNAPLLEHRARELTAEYWGETVWLTGVVAEPAFRRVVDELEQLKASGATASSDQAA